MKKVFYIAAAAALGLMSSCTEELDQTVPTGLAPDGKFYIDVTVTNPSADTRTVFDPATYEVSWLDTDEIGAVIFDGTDYTLHKFTKGESGNKFGTETFTPVAGTEYTWYLLYPYDEEFMVADGKTVAPVVNITSGSQSEAGDAGHVDTPIYGTAVSTGIEAPKVEMFHLATIIKVAVTNSTADDVVLSEISLAADGTAALTGTYGLDFVTGAMTASETSASAEVALSGISVAPGEEAVFYVPCAPFATESPVIASVTAGDKVYSSPKTASSYDFKAGYVYPTTIDCNPIAIKGSAVPDGQASLQPATENPAVYAWLGNLTAGKLSVVMPEGVVVPENPAFGETASYTLSSSFEYEIPSEGQYRVVLNTETREISVYDPATDLKPFSVTWYKDADPDKYPNPHTTVVENKLWYVGAGANWNATGNEILFTPSIADPQVLILDIQPGVDSDRRMRGGQTKFSIEAGAEFDAGGGDGVEVFNQSDWFLGSIREDNDGDGLDDTQDKNITIPYGTDKKGVWSDMYGGYDVRESWWNFGFWPDYIIMDLRHMKFLMDERYKW